MKYSVVGVYNQAQDLWLEAIPRLNLTSNWRNVKVFVYTDSEWRQVGGAGTFMIPFITVDGEYFYTSDGKMLLVKAHE